MAPRAKRPRGTIGEQASCAQPEDSKLDEEPAHSKLDSKPEDSKVEVSQLDPEPVKPNEMVRALHERLGLPPAASESSRASSTLTEL